MAKLVLRCDLIGPSFSPALAERKTGLLFASKNEPGEIATLGRYKGQPTPCGAATLTTPDEQPWGSKFDALLSTLERHIATIRDCGADDITLDLGYFHDGQCNHEFNPNELARIADLGLRFHISCYGPSA